MWRLLILVFCLGLAGPLLAQDDAQDDKTYLENWLQDALTGAGRNVSITGFQGALSSQASLAQMTISDEDGVWLTMRDAQLIWTRSALLSGRLNIADLSARQIEITRLPKSEDGLTTSDAEAKDFSLPELPVSVNIDKINIAQIILGPDVIGEPATLAVTGRVALAGGEGDANLDIRRTDRNDQLTLDGAFSNISRVLRLDLDFSESEGGLVSSLLNIPGAPALGLVITGEAPLSEYTATVALSSDGQPRFGGKFGIQADPESEGTYAFSSNLSGDVRPLFSPDMHPFFGERSSLVVAGLTHPDGRTTLDQLDIVSGAMELSGDLALTADGWPERFRLEGRISEGDRVRLPLSGPETTVESLTLSARYDAALGDSWTTDVILRGLAREGIDLRLGRLSASGKIGREPNPSVSGDIAFSLQSLLPSDPALARAIGPDPKGTATFEWLPDAPLTISPLVLQSDDMTLEMRGTVNQLADGIPVRGQVKIETLDLARFSGLAQRDLRGSAVTTLTGTAVLLSGAFEAVLEAQTKALSINEPRLDPLLAGDTNLTLSALRDTGGIKLQNLTVTNDDALITASGEVNAQSARLNVTTRLSELSLIEPRLSGPGEARARLAWDTGGPVTLEQFDAQLAETTLSGQGKLYATDPVLPVEGQITVQSDDLSRFAKLLGTGLAGQINLDLSGNGEVKGDRFDLTFDLDGDSLRTGMAQLDNLVAGNIVTQGSVAMNEDSVDLRYLKLVTPRLRANATGSGPGAPVAVSARLADLGILTNGISGPAEARGTLTIADRLARRITLDLNATGPGGIAARITGALNDYGQSLALQLTGTAPLELANRFISPRSVRGNTSFDLALNGPAQLSSLSGQATFSEARVALPKLDYAVNDMTGTVTLQNGSADITVGGTTNKGGRIQVTGPIALTAPFPADLAITLQALGVTDYQIYETTVNGNLTVSGPLLGGALIQGAIALGKTELRVPSGSGVTLGTLPALTHIGEPGKVTQTRKRAGLTGQRAKSTVSFPLDLTISAPNQIFVRGRGLDAELGGQMRVSGTTNDMLASGVFQLIRGRLDILGKRLVLTEGLIDLRGALDPYLRFVAETNADDVLVRVIVEGLASEPEVTFTSEPDLPQEEVVARLIFGRGLDTISPFQAAQLVGAVATLTGRYDGGVVGKLRKSLGLSDLDISTSDEGATQLRAGAYISDNIYSEVTADSDGKQQINLNLDVSKNVTVRGRADNQGDTGIGIFFEKDY